MEETWIALLVVAVIGVVVWAVAGRIEHWRIPGERWAELLGTLAAAFLGGQLIAPALASFLPALWAVVVGAVIGAIVGVVIIIGVTAPASATAVITCCHDETGNDEVAELLKADARTETAPGPPYVYPYYLTVRTGGAVVWHWDNACELGTKATITFKQESPFPQQVLTGEAPRPIVGKPVIRSGKFQYGLTIEQTDGTTCSVDPIIRGRR